MDVHYNKDTKADGELDFHRFVLLITHQYSPRIRFVSERPGEVVDVFPEPPVHIVQRATGAACQIREGGVWSRDGRLGILGNHDPIEMVSELEKERGMPVGGGLSRSAINVAAGAQTPE